MEYGRQANRLPTGGCTYLNRSFIGEYTDCVSLNDCSLVALLQVGSFSIALDGLRSDSDIWQNNINISWRL